MRAKSKMTLTEVTALVAIAVPLSLWHGLMLSLMWDWFVVPLGVSPITVSHAVGIGLLLLTLKRPSDTDYTFAESAEKALTVALYAGAVTGLGWLVSRCM